MGRGRARAKQAKIARELKYQTHSTDFTALQRELGDAPMCEADSEEDSEVEGADDPDATP